jgi:hypothetical protein
MKENSKIKTSKVMNSKEMGEQMALQKNETRNRGVTTSTTTNEILTKPLRQAVQQDTTIVYIEHGSAHSTKNISKTPQHKTTPAKQQTTSTGYQVSEKEIQELKGSATTSTQSLSRTSRNYNKKYGGVDTTKTRTKLRGENETRNTPSTCKVAGAGKATQPTQRSHYPKLPRDEFEHTNEKKKGWYKTIITPATIFTKEEAANEKEQEIKQQGDLENEKDNRSKQHTASKEDLANNDKESQAKVGLQRNRQHTRHNEYTN